MAKFLESRPTRFKLKFYATHARKLAEAIKAEVRVVTQVRDAACTWTLTDQVGTPQEDGYGIVEVTMESVADLGHAERRLDAKVLIGLGFGSWEERRHEDKESHSLFRTDLAAIERRATEITARRESESA